MKLDRKPLAEASKDEILTYAQIRNLDVDGRCSRDTLIARLRDSGEPVDDSEFTIPVLPTLPVAPVTRARTDKVGSWRHWDATRREWVECDMGRVAFYTLSEGAWVEADDEGVSYLRDVDYGKREYREELPDGSTVTARFGHVINIPTEKGEGGERPLTPNVGGRGMLIPRGRPVWVPEEFVEVLRNAIQMHLEPMDDGDLAQRHVQRFPFALVG